MIIGEIKITPEYWFSGEIDSAHRYTYLAPDRTLWNVSEVDGELQVVRLWAINAWGAPIYRSENYYMFTRLWQEYKP